MFVLLTLYRAELSDAASNPSRWWTVWQSDVGDGTVRDLSTSSDGNDDNTLPHKNRRISRTSANPLSVRVEFTFSPACTAVLAHTVPKDLGWLRGSVVERRSLAGELSLSCARLVVDG